MPTQLPRVNIVVTEEQYALLSELAALDDRRSVASVVREMVDQMTPLLRVTVPAMRAAKQELDSTRSQLKQPLAEFISTLQQLDLLEPSPTPGRSAPQRGTSEDAPPKRRRRTRRGSTSADPQGQ